MRLVSVETTPNPNSMKLNLDERFGAAVTYTEKSKGGCPALIERLLEIPGLLSVFACNDFITLNKDPRTNWAHILESATSQLSGNTEERTTTTSIPHSAEIQGQVHVLVQTFRGIPIQIKAVDQQGETRVSLGDRFNKAAQSIQAETGADFLVERYWADHGARYGERLDVAKELQEEIEGTFDDTTLERAKSQALGKVEESQVSLETLRELLQHKDWQPRLAAVHELSRCAEPVELLTLALKDAHPQVRRLAAAALGATGSAAAVAPLCDALLNDQSVGVRRTAGDALSDIGDLAAQPTMCRALSDSNKLVRWRAARFLSEVGTPEALPHLAKAADDQEFEIRLEVQSAIQRIGGGGQGLGPAWKRIVESS
jgi:Virulence factor/HEAT repeats/Scaffold protein Nfu/NifU N terminal